MTLDELFDALAFLSSMMDDSVDAVNVGATRAQEEIYLLLSRRIEQFEQDNGSFVLGQPIAQKIARITQEMQAIIGRYYTPRITEYLAEYNNVEAESVRLSETYNELVINKSLLTSARRTVYDQAEYYLLEGLNDAYIQPAKYLLMSSVSNGISLKDAKGILKRWNEGELTAGSRLTSDRATPRLQAYATQLSRDSLYGYQRSIQQVIANEYDLTRFIYVGSLVKDSRQFCKHLVSLRRKISLDEIPPLVKKYPEGLKPNTTKKNFVVVAGGFNCNHVVMMVR